MNDDLATIVDEHIHILDTRITDLSDLHNSLAITVANLEAKVQELTTHLDWRQRR